MEQVTEKDLQELYLPPGDSHKGQNGRLLIIGGSHLFHAASLWALEVASRIVDLVHYSSVPQNNQIVEQIKSEFRSGIVVPRDDIESYIEEDDCILIGPGMVRTEGAVIKNAKLRIKNLSELKEIESEGEQTEALTNYLLAKYPQKQWVIDAGALQMMDVNLIPKNAILTPHQGEFKGLLDKFQFSNLGTTGKTQINQAETKTENPVDMVKMLAKKWNCIILLKGQTDIACSPDSCREIYGGNAGMTKGGTGDVLAGLITALATKNDPYLATIAGSYINKKAGDELYKTVGPFFNATDLAREIPKVMSDILIRH